MNLAGTGASFMPISLDILLGRSKFFGCCFAFNRSLLKLVFPFPNKIEAHDMWIALVASLFARVIVVDATTLLRRIHDKNLTPMKRRRIDLIIKSRVHYIVGIILFLLNSNFVTGS
jgi:hypothetical protein